MSMFSVGDKFRVRSNGLTGTVMGIDGYFYAASHRVEYSVAWDHASGIHTGYNEDDIKDTWEKLFIVNNGSSKLTLPTGVNTDVDKAPFCAVDLKDVKSACFHDWRSSSAVKGKTKWCAICDERE